MAEYHSNGCYSKLERLTITSFTRYTQELILLVKNAPVLRNIEIACTKWAYPNEIVYLLSAIEENMAIKKVSLCTFPYYEVLSGMGELIESAHVCELELKFTQPFKKELATKLFKEIRDSRVLNRLIIRGKLNPESVDFLLIT